MREVDCTGALQEASAPYTLGMPLIDAPRRPEMVVGWYHSHPGFGCWLSGVDINTQQVGRVLAFGRGRWGSHKPKRKGCWRGVSGHGDRQQLTAYKCTPAART